MSLKSCVSLSLVVLLVCLDATLSAALDRSEDLGVVSNSDQSIVESVWENRTSDRNENALEVLQRQEASDGESRGNCGKSFVEESRKKKQNQNKNQKGFMERLLPMMIIPFMVSTAIIPLMLISLKFMVLKSAVIGKIAILLILTNLFRRRTSGEGGVFNHNVKEDDKVAMQHYGYYGDEEYGAYVNRRRRKRRSSS